MFLRWRGKFREGIDKPTDQRRGHVFDHIDQDVPIQRQVHGPPHAWIIERLFGVIDPHGMNDALVEIDKGQAWHGLCIFCAATGSTVRA